MIKIINFQESDTLDPELNELELLLQKAQEHFCLPRGDIEITLVDDDIIKDLNHRFRGRESATNVLSFPQFLWSGPQKCESMLVPVPSGVPVLLGEVYLSIPTIQAESADFGIPFREHLIKLMIHGILHLVGYVHETESEYEAMTTMEDSLYQFVQQLSSEAF